MIVNLIGSVQLPEHLVALMEGEGLIAQPLGVEHYGGTLVAPARGTVPLMPTAVARFTIHRNHNAQEGISA